VVATPAAAYELHVGDAMMGESVGTGCMLGASVATFAGATADPALAAVTATAAFGLAGEAAAAGQFGPVRGPASYAVRFRDAVAGLADADVDPARERVERVLTAG
jgi:hydroxyethylthiazole kinase